MSYNVSLSLCSYIFIQYFFLNKSVRYYMYNVKINHVKYLLRIQWSDGDAYFYTRVTTCKVQWHSHRKYSKYRYKLTNLTFLCFASTYMHTLQRKSHYFSGELRGLSPNFHIHVSVRDFNY
jgi:hypothetical protein